MGTEMDSTGRMASRRYIAGNVLAISGAALLVLDVLLFRPPGPVTATHKGLGLLLALLYAYAQTELRSWHTYYRQNARQQASDGGGYCKPVPAFPRDQFGLRYFLEAARSAGAHRLLESRRGALRALGGPGHSFVHQLFPETTLSLSTDEPELVRAVLSGRSFADWDIPAARIHGFAPILGPHSIFMANGPAWQSARAALRPAFVRDQLTDLRCFDRHISKMLGRVPAGAEEGQPFDLQALFALLTLDTISDFMFGRSTNILGKETSPPESPPPRDDLAFGACFDRVTFKVASRARLGWLTRMVPDRALRADTAFLKAYVDKYVAEVVKQRGSGGGEGKGEGKEEGRLPPQKDHYDEESPLSNNNEYVFLHELLRAGAPAEVVRDQLLSIFLAGRDTTTSVLSYLFAQLARHPAAVAEIQREIAELGTPDPSWEQLRGMKYLNWALKEALRLNPPVATNAREAIRDTILPTGGGPDGKSPTFVPKGTLLRYVPWSMHRREDIYGSDAEEFRPERWADLKVTFQYLPFNAGPRICIGQQFALTQMALVTFRLLQAFKTIESRDERPLVLKLGANTSLLHGCWVSMTK